MNYRPKTLRRLLILLIASVGIIAIGSVVVSVQLRRYERHRMSLRDAGMNAYQRGDYRKAADTLSKYLSNDRIDSPAIFACAVSRSKVAQPDMGNLLDARRQFNRYLELNPGDPPAQHQLLEIYQNLHYSAEAMVLADSLLAANPADTAALSVKLRQLVREQKFEAALPISMQLNELTPDDLRSQETTCFLLSQTGQPKLDVIARADGMLKAHPHDPRYEMLRAVAAYFTGDLEGARDWLKIAAMAASTDADFTLMLVSDLDRLEMWSDSLDLLKRIGTDPSAPVPVKAALVQRLWEFKEVPSALSLLQDLDPQNPAADSRLIGLQALMLNKLSRDPAEYQRDVKFLQRRSDDMTATGWALLLSVESQQYSDDTTPPLAPYLAAEHADPDNPVIRYCLAEQYDRMGESELAMQCLKQVSKMQPEWPAPFSERSRILLKRGEISNAIAAAESACDRFPKSFFDHAALENAEYASLGPNAAASDIQPVLELAQRLHASHPHDESLLANEVDLLARMDRRSEAVELALSAGSDADPAQPVTLRSLSIVDRANHLGIADQIVHQAGIVPIKSSQDAAAVFDVYVNAGEMGKARQLLPMLQKNGWHLAWLQARESMGDSAVSSDWEKFSDSLPDHLNIQRAALQSPAAQANRQLTSRTIDRLKALTGEDAIEWKLARARWLLGASEDVKTHASAAAELMLEVVRVCPDYAEPRVIWSDALAQTGDLNGAIASLQLAKTLQPQDGRISRKLAELQNRQKPASAAVDQKQ